MSETTTEAFERALYDVLLKKLQAMTPAERVRFERRMMAWLRKLEQSAASLPATLPETPTWEPTTGPCYLCGTLTSGQQRQFGGGFTWRCDNHPKPRPVPPHTPGR